MAIYKNDIVLIAGSGDFAYEAANFLKSKGRLKHIILLSKNYKVSKLYKNIISDFNIRDIENLIIFLKKISISKVLIIGYVQLPPISEFKLSLSSKLILSKNFFLNNINNQSKLLKKFIESKKLKLLSQKNVFESFLINYSDQQLRKEHKNIYKYILKNSTVIRKIFSLNLSQSLIMDGDRIITIEDIFGTDKMIKKFRNINKQFQNLIFIKSIKKNQISEIDFPVIGNQTLELLIKFNFKAICLLNKNILIANKISFLEKINKSKLSLIVI
ncbi:UDP-2,3-diacylglucosamine diphosphatase LpxI [Alphaproteobacteria bacterium]|nr:UDP-2,3-diacylglucosamine diphosphatase LpxI [Alphaproteobacteria bacterium]